MGNWIPNIKCFQTNIIPDRLYSLAIFISNDQYFKDKECKEVVFLLNQVSKDFFSQIHFITKEKHFTILDKLVKNEIKEIPITYSFVNQPDSNAVDAIISLKKNISTPFFFINANKSCFFLSDFFKRQINFISNKNIIYVEKMNNFFFHSLIAEELNIISKRDEHRLLKVELTKNVLRDNIINFKNILAANHVFFFQPCLIECIDKLIHQKKLQELFLEKKEISRLYDILEYINNVNMEKIYVSEK